ncbi:helix-turn-helix domain-containing protein [Flammeovirga pacifica]|uniref:HTH cro/C1-type domain-containing protein n=1 Tax=Flammeovirga pacifica TaxID=915059 RepID=A0A1S1Z285_FLAPC|nr:helix-turn-helix transcriptional regulator [Flammeovirga pacifica]OHX67384.1 hypothetical protein NH26_14035 [Flammeovirga pacifica]
MFNHNNHYGEKLRKFLRDRRITQHEASALLGVHRSTIQRLLENEIWSEKQLSIVTNGFGISQDDFRIIENQTTKVEKENPWKEKYYESIERINELYGKLEKSNNMNEELRKIIENLKNRK